MKVLLCDDHPIFRDGLRALLSELGHDVTEVATGEEALAHTDDSLDVVIMDLHLPGMSGVEATRALLRRHPVLAVLVMTMIADDAMLVAALRAGARGYLLKGAGHDEVRRALAAVAHGEVLIDATMAPGLAAGLRAPAPGGFAMLSPREREVLELMARGRPNEQIAATLFLSPKTVRNHVSAILAKLRVATRAEAVARARDAGLGGPGTIDASTTP